MKRFIRTIGGKTLFIFLFSLNTLLILVGAAFTTEIAHEGIYEKSEHTCVYERTKEPARMQGLYYAAGHISPNGSLPLADAAGNPCPQGQTYGSLEYAFRIRVSRSETLATESAEVLCQSQGFDAWAQDERYEQLDFSAYVYREEADGPYAYLSEHDGNAAEAIKITVLWDAEAPVYEGGEAYLRRVHLVYSLRFLVPLLSLLLLLGNVFIFVAMIWAAGRRPGEDEPQAGPLTRFPYDLLLGGSAFWGILWLYWINDAETAYLDFGSRQISLATILVIIAIAFAAAIFLGLGMALAARIKLEMLWKNLFIYRFARFLVRAVRGVFRGIGRLCRALAGWLSELRLIPLTVGAVAVLTLAEMWAMAALENNVNSSFLQFWLIEKTILIPLILLCAISMRKLEKAGQALAGGDMSYVPDTRRMLPRYKKHAANISDLSGNMAAAVEKSLKSERMKTELLTNVSHDIKTPLTSIINYTDLIGREETENPKISEYAEVLGRQSAKLKRLLEDLVEASKASTGNLEVNPEPCDAALFVTQAAGEYEEKLTQAGLSLVTRTPEQETRIRADGRRMWRVFDNLMNNAAKYSQPGTRIYLTLENNGKEAVFRFKNTSRDTLDISPDELMERFVRGDKSRTEEGNGLGLSIARSLTELQGGSLELSIDGDLFKVTLRFPLIG